MLKTLLLSGWFRVKPFLKYVVVVMLIAPLVVTSNHSTSATQSEVVASSGAIAEAKNAPASMEISVGESGLNQSKSNRNDSLAQKPMEMPMQMAAVVEPKLLAPDENDWSRENNSGSTDVPSHDPLSAVELVPSTVQKSSLAKASTSQSDLILKLKAAKITASTVSDSLYAASSVSPVGGSQPTTIEAPTTQPDAGVQQASEDPLGSAYPIPMKWITATQESMKPRGGGVRYYRSVPVVSPDGRYAVYSRVQLEVKPEMHNSRVSSVLFIEDRQSRKLRVISSTSRNSDVLINVKAEPDANQEGTIGVLVPVSWSQGGDRFLARRFEGVMNTSDVSDYAVVWHREKNQTNTVSPAHQESDREKISILLGWSKSQPNRVLFRTGEMGDENWPLVTVSDDGETASAADVDQPITFGNQTVQVWAGPQVAYR